eukprot:CAMPEP_0174354786 /NCGR_PEP_ID=MMETSP0811_2-20130205/20973_1 /TAXON_ID=73025 ORGANISM="Eutreptiella gymnastica-like, Strain CCMP1594" /NCGR_SAMPLE_ID=MMETSP0811_2 /ASSEMBLY_ACC=CAM_ASM_000667 /LENGTH=156 /DNA_ID=CAMNT_0015485803 /DNA_START=101 /DNA_END=568 /DNA_ORIENTATION=+
MILHRAVGEDYRAPRGTHTRGPCDPNGVGAAWPLCRSAAWQSTPAPSAARNEDCPMPSRLASGSMWGERAKEGGALVKGIRRALEMCRLWSAYCSAMALAMVRGRVVQAHQPITIARSEGGRGGQHLPEALMVEHECRKGTGDHGTECTSDPTCPR